MAREEGAVGREGQLLERTAGEVAREGAKQAHHIAPHERLASGETYLRRAAPHEGRAQPIELLEREKIALRQEAHLLIHAVDAAQIAAISHRDAQIGDRAQIRIDEL